MNSHEVELRLTVEALRAGVATKAAAKHVGTTQQASMEAFQRRLSTAEEGGAVTPLVIGGPFGSGKSHFLQCLRNKALAEGYAVSLLSVGPEVPLNRLNLVVRALANVSEAQGVVGKATRELAILQKVDSDEFKSFVEWVKKSDLDPRFPALVDLYEGYYADDEFRLRIVDDFEGRHLLKTEMRSRLKHLGISGNHPFAAIGPMPVAYERLRILPQFLRSCGQRGWVVLFDEVEVLGRFSLKQRIAAYESLGMLAQAANTVGSRLIPVFATTDGSYLEFMSSDEPHIESTPHSGNNHFARLARRGIDLFKDVSPLVKPDRGEAMDIMNRVKTIYDAAYAVISPEPIVDRELLGYQLRTQIRNWVTQWDLHRHYPNEELKIASGELSFHSEEISDELQANEHDLSE